ncbi:MAG: hypothetical protein VXZ38_09475 [Planctomycetota bacterium]|nr:hypothetical protein [Planctomycetota bacterium]
MKTASLPPQDYRVIFDDGYGYEDQKEQFLKLPTVADLSGSNQLNSLSFFGVVSAWCKDESLDHHDLSCFGIQPSMW